MAKVPGSIWVEGNNLNYVDQYGHEWTCPGYALQAISGVRPGSIWVNTANHYLYFVNEAGNTIMYPYPYGDRFAPITARQGSLWIDVDRQLHWLAPYDASQQHNVRAHNDVAAVAGHNDGHQDSIHTDIPHTNIAHTDVHSDYAHSDWHSDTPHYDSHSDYHDDAHDDHHYDVHSDAQHVDYNNPGGVPPWEWEAHYDHSDGPNYLHWWTSHNDSHGDIPHTDAHGDSHQDSAHQDSGHNDYHSDFWDGVAHQDVPHNDSAHIDVAHVDAHQDGHTDTPHTDEPYWIGP